MSIHQLIDFFSLFAIPLEIKIKIEIFSDQLELLKNLERLTQEKYLILGTITELNRIVETMELIVDPNSDRGALLEQQVQLIDLVEQYNRALGKLDPAQYQAHFPVLEQLALRIEALRLSIEKALEKCAPPSNTTGNNNNNDTILWGELTCDDLLPFLPTDEQMDCDSNVEQVNVQNENQSNNVGPNVVESSMNVGAPDNNGAGPSNNEMMPPPNNVVPGPSRLKSLSPGDSLDEPINNMTMPPPASSINAQLGSEVEMQSENLSEQNQQMLALVNNPNRESIESQAQNQEMVNAAVAHAMNQDGAFSYESLLVYNAMMIELISLPEMPEQATASTFRDLRDFIARFVRRAVENRIGMLHLEPLLISNVVASFNSTVFVQWKMQMTGTNASLRSIRIFLADQEEMANNTGLKVNRFKLASAVKDAQNASKKKSEPMPKSETKPAQSVKGDEKTGKGESTYSRVVRDGPSCSKWENATSSKCPPTRGRSMNKAQPGSNARTSSQASSKGGAKKGDKKKGENKKTPDCFCCHGPHQLFYCPRYLGSSLQERWEYVTNHGICPLCLAERHPLLACTHGECRNCQGDGAHNSTLCKTSYENKKKGFPPKREDSSDDE